MNHIVDLTAVRLQRAADQEADTEAMRLVKVYDAAEALVAAADCAVLFGFMPAAHQAIEDPDGRREIDNRNLEESEAELALAQAAVEANPRAMEILQARG